MCLVFVMLSLLHFNLNGHLSHPFIRTEEPKSCSGHTVGRAWCSSLIPQKEGLLAIREGGQRSFAKGFQWQATGLWAGTGPGRWAPDGDEDMETS